MYSSDREKRVTEKVNYFQHFAWQQVTLLEVRSGVWPYQSKVAQFLLQIFHFLSLSITMFATLNGLNAIADDNFDGSLENLILALFLFGLMVKQAMNFIVQRCRQKLYEKIVEHYEIISDPEEGTVIRESAEQGFKFAVGYVCIVCLLVATFDTIPIIRAVYYYLVGTGDLKLMLPIQMDYGVDHKKYWFGILIQFFLFVYTSFVVNVGFDLSFILQIRHVQALFTVVRMRLHKASEFSSQNDGPDDESYSTILSAITLHEVCFQAVKTMEKTYAIGWFILLSLNSTVFGACLHLITTKLHDPIETFRFLCAFLMLVMHFQVVFSHGQKIIDSSSAIYDACFQSQFLDFPKKSRKLLTMMMLRSTKICQITGAQFFPLSIETFGTMFKAGLSYYTVLE